ncbi:MAG: hypothetical protein WCO18_01325, partial [bacterium]
SNILAVSFYNAISKNAVSAVTGNQAQGGIGGAFMGAFRLQTLYPTTLISDTRTVSAGSGAAFAQSGAPISTLIGGSITMLVATIILLAALVMFIKRYVILILVMIFSPLAFAGMVLHQTEHSVQQWWNYLLKESFFAPVYMILLWISFSVITDSGFKTAIGYQDSQTLSKAFQSTENGQAQQGTKASPGFAGVLLDFMIVCALLIASLVAAEKMGVAGASGAMNFAKSAQGGIQGGITSGIMFTAGAAFNNTIGKMARTRIEKTHSSDLVARSAGQKIDEHGNISKAGFVSKWSARGELALGKRLAKGYEKKLEFESAYQSARDDEFHDDPKYQAAALIAATEAGENSTEQQAQDKLFHGYSTKQKANIMLNMQKQLTEENEKKGNGEHFSGNAAYQRYFSKHGHGRNTPEEYNEIMKITSQGTAFHNDQFREIIGKLGQKDEDDAKTIKKMTAEIENWKSSGQGISAIAGLGEELSSRFKDPAVANAFKNAIRNKFGDENFYSKMASDPGINEKVKNLSADAAYEIGSLGDYYKALTGGFKKITDKNGKSKLSTDDPKKDEELKKRFRDSIAKIDSDLLTKALGEYSKTGNIDVLIDAYRDNQLSADQAAANYVHQSNGTRSQRPSSEVAKEQEDIQKLVSKYNTSWK